MAKAAASENSRFIAGVSLWLRAGRKTGTVDAKVFA
jgi:hypothetical protein